MELDYIRCENCMTLNPISYKKCHIVVMNYRIPTGYLWPRLLQGPDLD